MKLFGNTEKMITKDKNDENALQLEITEVVLVKFNFETNQHQLYSRVFCTFVLNISIEILRLTNIN